MEYNDSENRNKKAESGEQSEVESWVYKYLFSEKQ